jgi:hypothetical protein
MRLPRTFAQHVRRQAQVKIQRFQLGLGEIEQVERFLLCPRYPDTPRRSRRLPFPTECWQRPEIAPPDRLRVAGRLLLCEFVEDFANRGPEPVGV